MFTQYQYFRCIFAVLLFTYASSILAKQAAPQELAATHGYVFVMLPKGSALPIQLAIKQVNQGKTISLAMTNIDGVHAYGAWVNPGEYVFTTWNTYKWGEHDSFRVEAGKITDLGSLVLFSIGEYGFVPLPLRTPETSDVELKALAEIKPFVSSDAIAWTPTEVPKPLQATFQMSGLGLVADLLSDYDKKVNKPPLKVSLQQATDPDEFLKIAKTTMPPLRDKGLSDANGNLYFPSDIGQIRVRSTDGTWSALDIGTIWQVTALSFVNGQLFAGAQNLIFRQDSAKRAWEQVATLRQSEWVTSINRTDKGWLIATIEPTVTYRAPSVKAVRIYYSEGQNIGELTMLKEIAVDDKNAVLNFRSTGSLISNGYYLANALDEFIQIKLDSMEINSIKLPSPVHAYTMSSDGRLLTAYFAKGMFSKVFVSKDNGTTWMSKPAPPYAIMDVQFSDESKGHAVRTKSKAFTAVQEVFDYDAATNSWKSIFEAPQGCLQLLHDASGLPNLCVTNGASVLRREGSEWVVEYSVQ